MIIVQDSRERLPYSFDDQRYTGVTVEVAALPVGDYSLKGLEHLVACERKSLSDLAQCLGRDRGRFVKELHKARGYDAFAVIVEGDWFQLASGQYGSHVDAHAACQSVLSFAVHMGVLILFCGNRTEAEYATWSFLRQYLEGHRRKLHEIVRAHGDVA